MKKYILVCIVALCSHVSNSQNRISGQVSETATLPLPGATIYMPEINKSTITDKNGFYAIDNIPNGKFKVQFSYLGYANAIETLVLTNSNITLDVNLKPTIFEAEEIVVTGGYNSTQHENAVKIDVLKLSSTHLTATPNFMEVLTKVPGVDMISKGSGVSKPVIRGLSMNDILVLNNGVRFENYQYSSHHPLGIDEFGIENVEVIKGPASLLYGSDAIGGVINFIKEKPALAGTVVGDYNLQLHSNTLGVTNNLGVKGASDNFFGGIRVGQKSNADFLQGGGAYAPNSRFTEQSLKTNVGTSNRLGLFKVFYDYNQQDLGLVEDEAIEAITQRGRDNDLFYQQLNTHLLSSQNKIHLGRMKLDVNGAYQNTELAHIAEPEEYELQMNLATLTYETKLHLPSSTNAEYILGFQGLNQKNTNINNRETLLLPNAQTNNYSGFALLQHSFFTRLKVQTGVRYDYKTIVSEVIGTPDESSTYRQALDKEFDSFSGSLGATYNVSDALLLRANAASAYRTPNLAELTSNGQHETRYEVGDPNLVPEVSVEADLSLHCHKDNYTFDVAGFYNRIANYIFISPTGQNTSTNIPIYQYQQNNSSLVGGEAGLHLHPQAIAWLHFETTYATVVGKQQNGDYLPFVPAHKLKFELRAEKDKLGVFKNVFASVNTQTAFDQNNAAPDETTTPGYTLLDLGLGGQLTLKQQPIFIGLNANNVLDTQYIDHLSTLKEVNLYNPGRNVSLTLKVPFGFVK